MNGGRGNPGGYNGPPQGRMVPGDFNNGGINNNNNNRGRGNYHNRHHPYHNPQRPSGMRMGGGGRGGGGIHRGNGGNGRGVGMGPRPQGNASNNDHNNNSNNNNNNNNISNSSSSNNPNPGNVSGPKPGANSGGSSGSLLIPVKAKGQTPVSNMVWRVLYAPPSVTRAEVSPTGEHVPGPFSPPLRPSTPDPHFGSQSSNPRDVLKRQNEAFVMKQRVQQLLQMAATTPSGAHGNYVGKLSYNNNPLIPVLPRMDQT